MSRPHYAQQYGPGQSDRYAGHYNGYHENSDPQDYPYDYNQDANLNHPHDRKYSEHRYQQPSRIPGPARSFSPREHTPGPPAMISPRRADQQQSRPSTAWEASQEAYDGAGYENEYAMSDQWPLPAPTAQPPPVVPPRSLRTPPRRPQRPDDPRGSDHQLRGSPQSAPHITPASRQYHQSSPNSHHGSGHWNGEGYSYALPPNYPPPSRPPPHALGSQPVPQPYATPQAPRQVIYGQANQRPPLGPPPSARRGTSSFYPQVGPVHPIVEETESMRSSIRTGSFRAASVHVSGHNSKVSVASSNAIPIGLEAPRIRRPDLMSSSEESFVESPVEPGFTQKDRFDLEECGSRDGESPEIMLVRQASLGRKQRPTLTTVKSGERKSSGSNAGNELTALPTMPPTSLGEIERARAIAQNKLEGGQTQPGAVDMDRDFSSPAVKSPAGHIVQGTSSGEDIPPRSAKPFQTPSSEDTSAAPPLMRKHFKDPTALSNEVQPVRSIPRSPLAPAADPRVESILRSLEKGGAISEQEAEKLKTPMAGMAGRKRPPRLDVDAIRDAEARGSLSSLPDLIRRATRLASNLDRGRTASRLGMNWVDGARDDEKRRSGRSSGMLSVFAAGGHSFPEGRAENQASFGRWSRMIRHSSLGSESDIGRQEKPKRPYCGMPVWLLVLLLVLLFMLVAAAVIVPVLLVVVLPDKDIAHGTAAASMGQCEKRLTCENGGTNVLSANGFCECLCINGHTGTSCQTFSATGCTMITVGSLTNATVGDSIPRLLDDASGNFSISLSGQRVLGLFSSSDLSCSGQNALVTFNERSRRKRDLLRRQDATPTSSTSAAPTTSSTSATPTCATDTQLDFARVAVLYVLQASSELDYAVTAQINLQTFFRDVESNSAAAANPRNVSLGNGYSCDLSNLELDLGNGTTLGGSGK